MGGLEETEDQRRLGASRGPQTVLLVDVRLQTLDKQYFSCHCVLYFEMKGSVGEAGAAFTAE